MTFNNFEFYKNANVNEQQQKENGLVHSFTSNLIMMNI